LGRRFEGAEHSVAAVMVAVIWIGCVTYGEKDLECWEGVKEVELCVWVLEEVGPVISVCAGEAELYQFAQVM
jgi:hypothetical protein